MPLSPAGCTVVLKPSEVAPLLAYRLADIVDRIGLPAGVFNLVSGGPDVGAALSAHPGVDMVSFTGKRALADGARVVVGGTEIPHETGYYVTPTVLTDVSPDSPIAQEEVFGPVLVILPYETEDEAVEIANNSPYGLSGGVWSADVDRAVAVASRLRTGMVNINEAMYNPAAPYGGYKSSGYGREGGIEGIREFLQTKTVNLPAPAQD